MPYWTYLVQFSDMLYTGQTNNIKRRLRTHAKLDKSVQLLYSETYRTREEALKRERQIKGWSRTKKEALIAGDFKALKEMARCQELYGLRLG